MVNVGIDLHKSQFTVFWRQDNGNDVFERYATSEDGYRRFEVALKAVQDRGEAVRAAVESTGNTRYFKNRIERCGVPVRVVNTAKFKVVTESVKKTDRHDAATLAEFLENDMLPVARLCSPESEELRRVLKTRTALVRTIVTVKNQMHGLLTCLGITTKRGELQSKRERRRRSGRLPTTSNGMRRRVSMRRMPGWFHGFRTRMRRSTMRESPAGDRLS
nr:transposase [Alkalispirochaeta sphaeroplastigenens]